ncbi:MAG: hypothetical protein GY769_20210 [bacterium]|nr:hypothetical protein [bacterium]
MNGFHTYEETDPRIGDVVTMLDGTGTHVPEHRPFSTTMVVGFERTDYGPLVHLSRVHAHLDEVMSSVRQSQIAVQVETYSVDLAAFRARYVAFTRGASGVVDNRNRHLGLAMPSWWKGAA